MDMITFAPKKSKISVVFAKRKHEVIEHLRENILPTNRALAKTSFPRMMDKVIVELKGELREHTFTRPRDGRSVTAKVIMFPDGSFAKRPDIQQMLSGVAA